MNASILDRIGNTPMVPLERVAAGLPVFVMCEFLYPGGSVEDRIALAIVTDAERRGVLHLGMTLGEATAGNTGVGFSKPLAHRDLVDGDLFQLPQLRGTEATLQRRGPDVLDDIPTHLQMLGHRLDGHVPRKVQGVPLEAPVLLLCGSAGASFDG